MCKLFIEEVLGCSPLNNRRGLYGDTNAYYGMVEQQGRLALHLHMLIWIRGVLSPQEVQDNILNPESNFQKRIVQWLEGCHMGEFFNGKQSEIYERMKKNETIPDHEDCSTCDDIRIWNTKYREMVDDLIIRSNVHDCEKYLNKDGCRENKYNKCKARFPRPTFTEMQIDTDTGAIRLKKEEAWINMFTSALTYVMRCNTDVTSLSSRTAIKAVVLYISNYITKTPLKTHVIFEVIREMFDKRRIVNLLVVKLEMGAPILAMYLMGQPDHYTDHKFKNLYWKSYVIEAKQPWLDDNEKEAGHKVTLMRHHGRVIGVSPVIDYMYRPLELENVNVCDWATIARRIKIPKSKQRHNNTGIIDEQQDTTDDRPKGGLSFIDGHPLKDTHYLVVDDADEYTIPNFIGETIPRKDNGDRDDYCMTMLTLFKPWRMGLDLKQQGEGWHDAFQRHKFTEKQLRLMKNFNLKYECLDERDDYHAQLRSWSYLST
ncbi:uncharacterized protein EV420DRAFT_1623165 [Desarmillaria tabescens]|uniref:Helitron helicase-like domain-containing protein n=1 Tax=Armillaria tabescens TaxID=1929756 RepID=A0AA39JBJ2_ARMTA|nr:uncharacterized protein EV420DRAFT_1623165 [Desarmillaria tabescens]KAK0439735.1 hypothetical protein EV420DRAFT_1623165 [Desarmillaria tabescens]